MPPHDRLRLSALALLKRLSHTQNDVQPGSQPGPDLAPDQLIRLAVDVPALGVADDNVRSPHVSQHVGGHLARVRPVLRLGRAVLAGDADVRPFEPVGTVFSAVTGAMTPLIGSRFDTRLERLRVRRVGDQLIIFQFPAMIGFSRSC